MNNVRLVIALVYMHGQAHQLLRTQKTNDLRRTRQVEIPKTKNSQTVWMLLRTLTELDTAYGQGKYDRACQLIRDIAELREALE